MDDPIDGNVSHLMVRITDDVGHAIDTVVGNEAGRDVEKLRRAVRGEVRDSLFAVMSDAVRETVGHPTYLAGETILLRNGTARNVTVRNV